ncbi:MAG: hypothetical protein JST39_25435 [Bacteroidetes bacterium]|nr:hypothetical protein [Bacteroidota bacterium]
MKAGKIFFNLGIVFFFVLGLYFRYTGRTTQGPLGGKYGMKPNVVTSSSLFFFALVFLVARMYLSYAEKNKK